MPIIEDDELADLLAQFDQPVKLAATTAPVPVDDEPPVIRVTERPTQVASPPSGDDDDGDFLDAAALLSSMGAHQEQNVPDIKKAWMNYHEFVVVDSIELLSKVVDQALVTGKCSLDLETEGLDNRIYLRDPSTIRGDFEEYWDGERPDRILQTVHKIVGYCLSPDGYTGYYVPVRHTAEDSNNLDVVEAGKLIKKLCRAAQPVITEEGRLVDPLASPLIKPAKVKIFFWHAKFDQEFLLPVTGIDFWHPESFEDGMLVYYCIYTNDKNLSLKDKSKKELRVLDKQGKEIRALINPDPNNSKHELVTENPRGVTLPYEMIELKDLFVRGRNIQFGTLRPEEARYYACSDAICTFLHCDNPVIISAIKDKKYAGVYRIEKQVVQVLRWMERNRIKIDHEYVKKLITEAKTESKQYRDQIVALADQYGFKGFDPNSTQQLSAFLFGDSNGLNLPKPDKTGNELRNQYKTDADTLEKLVETNPDINPILLTLVKYRQVEKVIGTYLEGMLNNCDENSELRYQFKQTGAPTGRFTAPAGDPAHGYGGIPIHGIPSTYDDKKPKVATALRQAFVARDGYTMVKVDYAGEELRIVTNLSAEPVWTDEFLHGSGDLHSITARAFFGQEITKQQRQQGKIANFSLVYGGGTMAIMRATKCSQQEAARRKTNFDKAMPVFSEWVKKQKAKVKRDKGVFTAFGRWMSVPDVDSPDKAVVAACERYSLNYPIQGCICSVSQILTSRGYQTVGDLVGLGGSFTTWTGSKWATAVAKSMGNCQLAELTLSDGTIVRCDTRHKQLGVASEGYQWVDFDDLTEGLRVATSLCYPVEFSPPALPKMGERLRSRNRPKVQNLVGFWYWMGRYVGDGNIDPRGAIRYSFGSHERVPINGCLEFWGQCGLDPKESNATHIPKNKKSTRYSVEICSVDLIDWLAKLGFHSATAHTKRLPSRILQETLEHRKSFIRGIMDSDGHKPPMVSAKGNPYNIHLCQRPLLEDLKLLLRTLGVESVIRGPYKSGSDKNGYDTTSYRLDINRRMFERNVQGVQNRGPKFHDMFAPDFLVKDFLSRGKWVQSDFRDNSSYVLYRRLVNGGRVTVYTLDDLCKQVGVTLQSPIYGHKRINKIKIIDQIEETYTLSVKDPLHRFEADGVITKNSGADIMKMSMVMLYKEFHKQGWIQNNIARFMLTVHDEIVFEVKHENLVDVMPVIERIMTEPARMVRWKVPLEVEPLIDQHWDPHYDYHKIMKGYIPEKGKKPKDTDVLYNGRYYQEVPPWLKGILIPEYMKEGGPPPVPPSPQEPPPVKEEPVERRPEPTPQVEVTDSPVQPKISDSPPRASVPPSNGNGKAPTEIFRFHLKDFSLTRRSIEQVQHFCKICSDSNGKVLHLLHSGTNATLVSPELNIKVNPDKFEVMIETHNL